MKPSTMVGSTSSSSYNHSRKRRPASWPGTSKSAVRAPSSRYASTNYACVLSTFERVEASALSMRLRRALNLASSSSARWLARLLSARTTLASARAACASTMAWFVSLLSSASWRWRSVFSASMAATFSASLRFAFRSRLLLNSIRMLRPETLDFGSHVHSQDTRRNAVGEVGRLTKKNT
jgi:hypothetical protein